jgi:hypothetical protein
MSVELDLDANDLEFACPFFHQHTKNFATGEGEHPDDWPFFVPNWVAAGDKCQVPVGDLLFYLLKKVVNEK